MNQSRRITNWNSNSWLQSNKASFNPTAAKMAKKSLENLFLKIWNSAVSGTRLLQKSINHTETRTGTVSSWLQSNTQFQSYTCSCEDDKIQVKFSTHAFTVANSAGNWYACYGSKCTKKRIIMTMRVKLQILHFFSVENLVPAFAFTKFSAHRHLF
jgi:hypothetical protein